MYKLYTFLSLALAIFPNLAQAQCTETSLYFDGVYRAESTSNDHVDVSTFGPMSTIESGVSYTIEAWVKRDYIDNPGGYERIISKDFIYQFRVLDNQFVGEIGTSSVQTPYPADNLWHHLAFVRNAANGTLHLYIDGQHKAAAPDNSTSLANNGAMVSIGARNNGIGQIDELWKGNIRWMRVSKAARYLTDFTPPGTYSTDSQTLAIWPFDTGTGTVLKNLAGYPDGTIINATWTNEAEIPSLSAQSTLICAGLNTQINASGCAGTLAWGTGESGSSITVNPYATTTYAARCVSVTGCASQPAELTIEVEGVMPHIAITANPGTFVQKGETVTFTASIANGGTSPVYEWRKNGAVVGTNSPNYTDSQLNSGDKIRCILTSTAPCRQLDKVGSNELTIQIPELITNNACGEALLALSELPYTEIRWKKNGQYVENPAPGSRGSGVTVAGNPGEILLTDGSVFIDEANAIYASSNKGILKIEPNGKEDIVVHFPDIKHFYRTRTGSFYIAYQDRVEKWETGETQGTPVAGGNGLGNNPNQLSINQTGLPGIQVTESGAIYIADTGNNRIQRWDPGATAGVTVAQGEKVSALFFVDSGNNLFTAANGIIYKWAANTPNPVALYSYPISGTAQLTLLGDNKGNLYMSIYRSVSRNTYIYRFNANGVTELFSSDNIYGYSIVYGFAIAPGGEIYVNTNFGANCCDGISRWSPEGGLTLIRERGFGNATNMVPPNDVFVNASGDIFTVGGDRVQKWAPGSSEGTTVAGGNGSGSSADQLNNPTDVAQDNDGNIYVVDKNNHRVQRFSPGSSLGITVAGGNGPGTAANQLNFPTRFFLAENRTLFIADGKRVQRWNTNATSGITVATGFTSFSTVTGVFVKNDTIYLADGSIRKWAPGASSGNTLCGTNTNLNTDVNLNRRGEVLYSNYYQDRNSIFNPVVQKWSPGNNASGECIPGQLTPFTQGGLYTPTGIFIDSLNNLYVADTRRKKIQKFLATAPTLTDSTGGQFTAEVTIGTRTLTLNPVPGNVSGLCESTGSGAWNNAALWTCGHVPRICDQVVIGALHTVTLAETVQISGLEIRENGNLSLAGGNVKIAKP